MRIQVLYFYLVFLLLNSCNSDSKLNPIRFKKIILNSEEIGFDDFFLKMDDIQTTLDIDSIYQKYLIGLNVQEIRNRIQSNYFYQESKVKLLDSNIYYNNKVLEFYIETNRNSGIVLYFVQGIGEIVFVELTDHEDPTNIVSYIRETNDIKVKRLIASIVSDTSFFVINKLNRKTTIKFIEPN